MIFNQYDICIVDLNPIRGSEMAKIRPCIILSPLETNKFLRTVIIAPITSKIHRFKFRVLVKQDAISGEIALDHIRSVDKSRIGKIVTSLDKETVVFLKRVIREYLVD